MTQHPLDEIQGSTVIKELASIGMSKAMRINIRFNLSSICKPFNAHLIVGIAMRLVGLVSVTNKALQVSPRLVRYFLNHTLHSVVKYTYLCLEPLPLTTIEQFSQLRSSIYILSTSLTRQPVQ